MLFELDTVCATSTKKNAQGYKIGWKGYKRLHAVQCGAWHHNQRGVSPPAFGIASCSGLAGTCLRLDIRKYAMTMKWVAVRKPLAAG